MKEAYLWEEKGRAYMQISPQVAIECFNKALKMNPQFSDRVLIAKGEALCMLKRYKEAIECYDKALKINHKMNCGALDAKGEALYQLKRYKEALKCFDKSLKIEHRDSSVWRNKGIALEALGKNKEADICFKKAESLPQDFYEI